MIGINLQSFNISQHGKDYYFILTMGMMIKNIIFVNRFFGLKSRHSKLFHFLDVCKYDAIAKYDNGY